MHATNARPCVCDSSLAARSHKTAAFIALWF